MDKQQAAARLAELREGLRTDKRDASKPSSKDEQRMPSSPSCLS